MAFITLIKNNIKYTYSLQFFTFLSNSFQFFSFVLTIIFNSFQFFPFFLIIMFNSFQFFPYNSFQFFPFFLTFLFNFFSIFHFFLQFFSNYFQFFPFFLTFFFHVFQLFPCFLSILSNSSVNSKELSKNRRIRKELPEMNWRIAEKIENWRKRIEIYRNRFLLLYSTSGF